MPALPVAVATSAIVTAPYPTRSEVHPDALRNRVSYTGRRSGRGTTASGSPGRSRDSPTCSCTGARSDRTGADQKSPGRDVASAANLPQAASKPHGSRARTRENGRWRADPRFAEFFLSEVPTAQHGHALGLFLEAFGLFAIVVTAASFRTNLVVVVALLILVPTFFILGAGEYGAHETLTHIGGYLGIVVAAMALYLSCAETCAASYDREVLPIWPLNR